MRKSGQEVFVTSCTPNKCITFWLMQQVPACTCQSQGEWSTGTRCTMTCHCGVRMEGGAELLTLAFPSYCELLILMSRLCAHLVIDQLTLALLVTFPYLRSKWTGQDIHSFQTSLRYSVSKQPAKTPDNHCSVGNTHVQIAHTYTSKFISLPRLYFLGFFLSLQT